MPGLKAGQTAPDFMLSSTGGTSIRLSDFEGKKNVVLYFYPKDHTPGCTQEACDFRDAVRQFQALGAAIFGISFDTIESHQKFTGKLKLPFPLLSDERKEVAKKYGVYKKKSLYGKSFMGIERTTFVIDRSRKVRNIFQKVKVEGHISEVLSAVKSL